MKNQDAIIIIAEDERLVYKFGASKIYYRRMSPVQARVLREQHTLNGEIDTESIGREGMERSIVGWEGVKDASGKDVPFSIEKIEYLPGRVRAELTERIINGDHYNEVQKQLKN